MSEPLPIDVARSRIHFTAVIESSVRVGLQRKFETRDQVWWVWYDGNDHLCMLTVHFPTTEWQLRLGRGSAAAQSKVGRGLALLDAEMNSGDPKEIAAAIARIIGPGRYAQR